MNDPKYVKFENGSMFIFHQSVPHEALRVLEGTFLGADSLGKIESAGFVHVNAKENGTPLASCYGRSSSLDLQPNPNDWKTATRLLGGDPSVPSDQPAPSKKGRRGKSKT